MLPLTIVQPGGRLNLVANLLSPGVQVLVVQYQLREVSRSSHLVWYHGA